MLQQGSIFDNRYQLVRLLGRGGFSEVWLAKDSYTGLEIAIKVYAPGQGMDTDGLVEFSQELAGVFNLNHTNLLKPTHVDAWEGMPYLILPFCSQGSIVKRVGKMQEEEIWKLIHDVASGLAYLHQHDIVHQDIKPDNILMDDNGNYLITDFGISTKARSTLRKSVAAGTINAGTMAYMGPERFSKQPTPTRASDIWSFGAMVYELITGNVPFGDMGGGMQKNNAEIPDINEPVSDDLKQVVEQMMALDKDARPTARQLIEIANTHLGVPAPTEGRKTQRIKPAPVPPVEHKPAAPAQQAKPEQPNRKKRIIIWTSVLVLLVIAGAAIGVYSAKGTKGNNKPSEQSEWHSLIKPEVTETSASKLTEEATKPQEVIPEDYVLVPGGTMTHYCYDHTDIGWNPLYKSVPMDSFYISKYEVIQKDYAKLMEDNPSPAYGDSLPVSGVTFAEAAIYCNRLSKAQGYEGFYTIQADTITFNPSGHGYRLPTRYEWAYASRDRRDYAYKYAGGDDLKEIAWYAMNSNGKAHKVGTKKPNKLGIYDMSGNVYELLWVDEWKVIKDSKIGGAYNLYNFSSETYQDHNCLEGGFGLNDVVGFRMVFIPKSIRTNNNITNTKLRRVFHQYKYTWQKLEKKEAHWHEKVSKALLPYNEGRLYEYGYGAEKDIKEAMRWYRIAADNGITEAKEKLKKLQHNKK